MSKNSSRQSVDQLKQWIGWIKFQDKKPQAQKQNKRK